MEKQQQDKIKELFLKKGVHYNKNQYWVVITKEALNPNSEDTFHDVMNNGALFYPLEDFLEMIK